MNTLKERKTQAAREWQKANADRFKESVIKWRNNNKEKLAEYRRKYYLQKKTRIKETSKAYYEKHKEDILEKMKEKRILETKEATTLQIGRSTFKISSKVSVAEIKEAIKHLKNILASEIQVNVKL